jgi:CheY-like chemotaxis protein
LEVVAAPHYASAVATSDSKTRRVLVVDDEPLVRDSIKMILDPVGYEVVIAENGPIALDLLEKNQFDLVLLDYSMPKMRGDEVAERIKEKLPDLPIIMMTAYAEMLECKLTPLTGVEEILCKPFRAGSLRELVAKFIPDGQAG